MQPLSQLRRKPLLAAVAVLAFVAVVLLAAWPREPQYQGKSLSYWLDRLPEKRAIVAVEAIGPRSLPMLIRRLQSKPPQTGRFRYSLRVLLYKLRLGGLPDERDKRKQAFMAIIHLRDTAKPILPDLIDLVQNSKDPGVRELATEAAWHLTRNNYDESLITSLDLRDLSGAATPFHGFYVTNGITNRIVGLMPTNFAIGAHSLIYEVAVGGPAPTTNIQFEHRKTRYLLQASPEFFMPAKGCVVTIVRFDAPNGTIDPRSVILSPGDGLRGRMSFDDRVNDYQMSTFTNN
jgi:hypothetical protein